MFGAKKQVLLVGNEGVQLYTVSGKRVALYADFSESGANLSSDLRTAFRAVGTPLILQMDIAEQQYRKEVIPNVGFMDRSKVIQRKLAMAFPQQQMRAYITLGNKSRDDTSLTALFAAVTPTLTVTQIMDAVLGSEINVQGALLLPIESTGLAAALAATTNPNGGARWTVLMTKHKTGGLRQIVIKDGELALTRLTPFVSDLSNRTAMAEEIIREFNATLTYLARFGYVSADGLDLIVVASDDVCDTLNGMSIPVSSFSALTPYAAAKAVGLNIVNAGEAGGYGEALHAGWVATQRKPVMPMSAPLLDKVRQARQLSRVAILAGIMGAAYMGFEVATLSGTAAVLNREIADAQSRRQTLQSEYDTKAKELNTLQFEPEKIGVIMSVYDEYKSQSLDIDPTVSAIVSMLDRSAVRLKSVRISPKPFDATIPAPPPDTVVKPQADIELRIGFADGINAAHAATATKDFFERLKARLPGRSISIIDIAGNLAVDKTVQGSSENALAALASADVKLESTIRISGALE
jgi:hypothetical protein